jgi:hypothetical protein
MPDCNSGGKERGEVMKKEEKEIEKISVWTRLSHVPSNKLPFHKLAEGYLITKAPVIKPRIFDIFKQYMKVLLIKIFWIFVSLILFSLMCGLLYCEGWFWYNFTTGGLSPFTKPLDFSPERYTFTEMLPIIGVLPAPIYLDKTMWWTLVVPVITLILVLASLWREIVVKAELDRIPIFEFFNIIIHPGQYPLNSVITASFGFSTMVAEALFAYVICYKYLAERSYIASYPVLIFFVSLVMALLIPTIFTLLEVYIFVALRKIFITYILPRIYILPKRE